MSAMRRVRPFWAVVAAMCVAVVLASVVASVATGMGWEWSHSQQDLWDSRGIIIAQGGVRIWEIRTERVLSGIPLLGRFFYGTPEPAWIPRLSFANGRHELTVPFWTVGAAVLAGAAIAWRRMMRSRLGCCVQCGYTLAGLSGNVCPECGTACELTSKEQSA